MRLSKWISLALLALLCLSMLPAMAAASPRPEPGRLDPVLQAALAGGGTSDLLVEFSEQADLSAAYGMDWEARGRYVIDSLRAVARQAQAEAVAYLDAAGYRYETFIAGNQLYVRGADLGAALDLAALPRVTQLRAPVTVYLDPMESLPPGPDATTSWGIVDTNADDFWATFSVRGEGIKVANIDTGVQWDHPALVQSFACPGQPANPACWRDPSNICGAGGACDNNGHGTHTMGTMVGSDDPGLTYMAGMAPAATWIACKGCEYGSCTTYALNTCADWLLAPGGDPNNRPHVVNNSWGGAGGDNWYLSKVTAWRAAGIFPAFSAGNNSACGSLGSPGDYQQSFGTTGHNSLGTHYYAQGPSPSGHHPYTKPNISAPAVGIISTVPANGWASYSGTSMASPHSAGAVALLWSCSPALIGQVDQTFEALQAAADAPPAGDCGAPPDGDGNYTFGYGYLDVLAAGGTWCTLQQAPPAAPSYLAAAPASASQINLTWTDGANDESGFRLERGPDGVTFSALATVGANVTGYSDTGLLPSTAYWYRVVAFNAAGDSGYSNVAGATTHPPTASMFVSGIALSQVKVRNKYAVTGMVTVQDTNGSLVTGATVTVKWTYPPLKFRTQNAPTNGEGVASFTLSAAAGTYTLCVTGVTKTGWVYNPALDNPPGGCASLAVP